MSCKYSNFRFKKTSNGAYIHSTIPVFRKKSDSVVFNLVSGSHHDSIFFVCECVKCHTTKTRTSIDVSHITYHFFIFYLWKCFFQRFESLSEIDSVTFYIWISFLKPCDMVLRSVYFLRFLMNRKLHTYDFESRFSTKGRYESRVYSSRNSDDETCNFCTFCIFTKLFYESCTNFCIIKISWSSFEFWKLKYFHDFLRGFRKSYWSSISFNSFRKSSHVVFKCFHKKMF